MTKPTGRPVGRPRKNAAEPQNAQTSHIGLAEADDLAYIEHKLLERTDPKRKTLLRPDEETLRTLFCLSKLFCTQEEAAGFLGVHRTTLGNFMKTYQVARDAWDDGQEHAKISLRRKQLARCDKSDTMNIFLGKQYLGQRDDKFITQTITHSIEDLDDKALLEIAAQARPDHGASEDSLFH